ncbi:MAG: nucleoside deaminase [Candidatus Tantalella remota]|nr:nucleoside deaminase [Candidatus Tantalella remota]
MKAAIDEAYKGIDSGDGGPFGAVLVSGDRILASSHNRVLADNDPTRHAEVNVISEAARGKGTYDLSGSVLYTTTEPCPMCFSAIHWARIEKIVYGTDIEDVRVLGFNELTIPVSEMKSRGVSGVDLKGGFMRAECEELLKYWKTLPDAEVY